MVIVDCAKAFIGGLDLCYGRWDTPSHPLTDLQGTIWPGIDYSNSRIADFSNVEQFTTDSLDRNTQARMPWHDIAVMVTGPVASDLALHFAELWNFVMTDITANYFKNKELLQPSIPLARKCTSNRGKQDPTLNHKIRNFSAERSKTGTGSISEGLRVNIDSLLPPQPEPTTVMSAMLIQDFQQQPGHPDLFLEDEAHEVEWMKAFKLNDVARPSRSRQETLVWSELEELDEVAEETALVEEGKQGDEQFARSLLQHEERKASQTGLCECQLVVSCGLWSYGCATECSIAIAYMELISTADHFIYIENQFFISDTAGAPVKNMIAKVLVDRIIFAAKRKEQFKVIVVMPLLPAFEGSVDDQASKVLRVQLHWEYATIKRGERSIYQQLMEAGIPDPSVYISFYGLRTHGILPNGNPVTEIVYVHSKLMIVDDKYALIGSANINDRSMVGDRDSEVAIFAELLGETDPELFRDPMSDEFQNLWNVHAQVRVMQNNTVLYRDVFRCYPDDAIGSIQELRNFTEQQKADYFSSKDRFVGYLVNFPLDFLSLENLEIPVLSTEYLIPRESFV